MAYADRHAQLVDTAEALFVERGYAAVTMEDIARAAGVSRPIVYTHFETREGAYLACVMRARAAYDAAIRAGVDPAASPRDQLTAGADVFLAMLESHPGRWLLLFGSNAVVPGEANDDLAALRFATIEQVRLLLQAAAPDAPPERIEAFAHAISGVGERLGHWWRTRPDLPREVIRDHYVEIIWAGLQAYLPQDGQAS